MSRGLLRRFRSESSGQALVEFALLMPLLLGLVVGVIELGQMWRSGQVITHVAREGARLAVTPTSTPSVVSQRIRDALAQGGLDPDRATVVLGLRTATGTPDTVTIRYPHAFNSLGPVVRLIDGGRNGVPPGSVQLTSTFVMRNE